MLEIIHKTQTIIQKQFRTVIPPNIIKANNLTEGMKIQWENDITKYRNYDGSYNLPNKSILLVFIEKEE